MKERYIVGLYEFNNDDGCLENYGEFDNNDDALSCVYRNLDKIKNEKQYVEILKERFEKRRNGEYTEFEGSWAYDKNGSEFNFEDFE